MGTNRLHTVLRHLRQAVRLQRDQGLTDAQLLERFVAGADEAAFEVLVWRHGATVLGVCRRLLRHEHDAEDAFQATFLAFVRKARSIRKAGSLGSWLYKVAYRTALEARAASRRAAGEELLEDWPAPGGADDLIWRDLRSVLDEEVNRLPAKYLAPFVLCHVEGKTNKEAARELGWPEGTLATRLAWARRQLRARLARRGLALSVGLSASLLSPAGASAMPADLVRSTVQAALTSVAGRVATGGLVSAPAATLADAVVKSMLLTKLKTTTAILLAALLLGGGGGLADLRHPQCRAEGGRPRRPVASGRSPGRESQVRPGNASTGPTY